METFLDREREFLASLTAVYSSPEPKALGTAERAADLADVTARVDGRLREVDRSGEGFVGDHEYRRMVERYFRDPAVPFGWEDRRDVERRVRGFVAGMDADGELLVVSHGMLLTTMLAPLRERDSFEFWTDLAFGELLQVDAAELGEHWS